MKDILVLREIEEIKAISHPYRLEILEIFGEKPLSAKQLSEILGEPHAKINYHIKALLNVGILELVEEKVKSGIIEKYYLPKAKSIVIDKSIGAEKNEMYTKHVRKYDEFYLTKEEAYELVETLNDKIYDILKNKDIKDRENTNPYSITIMSVPDLKR